MDDLEGEVADEEVHECALRYDILSADLNSEDALLLNIRQHRVFGVAHNVGCLICGECIGKVAKPRFNVVSECLSAFVSHLDIAVCNSHGIYRIMVMQYHRLLCRLGVEDTHRYLLAPLGSFLLQISLHILKPYNTPFFRVTHNIPQKMEKVQIKMVFYRIDFCILDNLPSNSLVSI